MFDFGDAAMRADEARAAEAKTIKPWWGQLLARQRATEFGEFGLNVAIAAAG